jgi:photosystem II cytochrome c550
MLLGKSPAIALPLTHTRLMLYKLFARYFFLLLLVVVLVIYDSSSFSAQAANIDSYIVRYLHITEPIALNLDGTW